MRLLPVLFLPLAASIAAFAASVPRDVTLIDDASALGTQVEAVDLNKDGAADVLTASKLGVFVFLTQRK